MYTKNKIYEKGRYAAILSRIPFPQKVTRKEIYFIFFYEESSGDIFQENPDQVISTRKKKKFLSGLNTKRAGWLLEMYCARVQQVVFPFWFFGDSALSWTVVFF